MFSSGDNSAKSRRKRTDNCFGLLFREPNKMVILQDPGNISESLYTICRKYTQVDPVKHFFNDEKLFKKSYVVNFQLYTIFFWKVFVVSNKP